MTAPPPQTIDVDDPATWPSQVVADVQPRADEVRGTREYLSDLPVPVDGEDEFRALLAGYPLLAYHATRLLDQEVAMLRAQGLRPLTADLLTDRIEAAFANGCVTEEERARLQGAHLFAKGQGRDMEVRPNTVNLFLSQHALREEPDSVSALLTTWGGEGIYMTSGGYELRPMLRKLGRPALVVVKVDLSDSWRTHFVHPHLRMVFVANFIQPGGLGASVAYHAPVPPEQVVAIWQPSDPEYDEFDGLPRT